MTTRSRRSGPFLRLRRIPPIRFSIRRSAVPSDHRNRVAGFFIVGKIHVHQIRAGGVHDVPSVGTDARVQHRFEFIFLYRDGSRRARRKVGEEKLPVDGEGHAVAGTVDAIRDDAGSAFARTFASRLLFRRNVFRVGVGKQYARIGERNLTDVASSSITLIHSEVTVSSGPSERRNSAREPSAITRAERGAPQENRKVRAFLRGNCRIASVMLPTYHHPNSTFREFVHRGNRGRR